MENETKLDQLRRLDAAAVQLRRELQISPPGELLFSADLDVCSDRQVVVEADGFGGATVMVVEGNYPMDCLQYQGRKFASEDAAREAAEQIATGTTPDAVLSRG